MEYIKQVLCNEIIVLLHGSKGMLDAANQYCDNHPILELTEYVDWLILHDLKARFYRYPGIKGILNKYRVQRITDTLNRALRDRKAYITQD